MPVPALSLRGGPFSAPGPSSLPSGKGSNEAGIFVVSTPALDMTVAGDIHGGESPPDGTSTRQGSSPSLKISSGQEDALGTGANRGAARSRTISSVARQ